VFFYDISYDTAAGAQGGLTNTTQGSFCGVLFEYLSHAADAGVLRVPCVTNQNDGADDGNIGAAGQGYGVASVAISQTPAENVFNAPLGLTGKNVAGSSREYETANRTNDNTYGNLIAELTYGELYNKVCTTQKTKIRIQNNSGATHYARLAGTNGCVTINSTALGVCAAGDCYIDIYQGSSIAFYSDSACTTTACGSAITFNMSATNDAGTTDWNGASVNGRDGNVQITGALTCTLSDNASTHGIP
jgi:hypothetical protein